MPDGTDHDFANALGTHDGAGEEDQPQGGRRPQRRRRHALDARASSDYCAFLGHAARGGRDHHSGFAAQVRPFFECPAWVRELAGSLPWRERFRYRFRKAAHINVLEAVAYGTLLRNLAASAPESRPVIMTDSRVVLGATAKGRSSSRALNGTLRTTLPYVLGGDLYPGGIHLNSDANPADAPSRGRPVPAPSCERPAWLDDLTGGACDRFDAVLAGSAAPRALGFWVRLLLLAAGGPGAREPPHDDD